MTYLVWLSLNQKGELDEFKRVREPQTSGSTGSKDGRNTDAVGVECTALLLFAALVAEQDTRGLTRCLH